MRDDPALDKWARGIGLIVIALWPIWLIAIGTYVILPWLQSR
jgi:hypothetical protein